VSKAEGQKPGDRGNGKVEENEKDQDCEKDEAQFSASQTRGETVGLTAPKSESTWWSPNIIAGTTL
jgi:hypothetical protein